MKHAGTAKNLKARTSLRITAVIMGLVVIAIVVRAWFIYGNQTSYPSCTSLEYKRLQSLFSTASMPSGARVVSGPTLSCTARGLGKLTSVGYVVDVRSYANYLALENAFRTSLAKSHLAVVQTSKDQLEMARGANTAFYMLPAQPATSASGHGDFLTRITIQDGPI